MDRRTQLPQELMDIIFESTEDGKWTLRSCSLVCSSWLHSSRRHLFRRIVLLPPSRRHYDSGSRPTSDGQRLHNLLNMSPHIATYIRELKLYEGWSMRGRAWVGSDQSLPLVLGMLKGLKRIELRRLRWNNLPLALRHSIRNILELPTLQFLEMELSDFASIDDFSSLLSHAKGLTGLSLAEININYSFREPLSLEDSNQELEATEQRVYSCNRRHLLDLRLMAIDCPKFVDWLLGPKSPFDVSHIQTLHITDLFIFPSVEHIINRLLHAIDGSLNHLKLDSPGRSRCE
jgi:hypothetical protein